MAKKVIHTVTFEGVTYKRESASRRYNFAAFVRQTRSADRRQVEQNARSYFALNHGFYAKVEAGNYDFGPYTSEAHKAAVQATAREFALGLDHYVAKALADFDRRFAGLAEDYVDIVGWSRTADLARKNAARFAWRGQPIVVVAIDPEVAA